MSRQFYRVDRISTRLEEKVKKDCCYVGVAAGLQGYVSVRLMLTIQQRGEVPKGTSAAFLALFPPEHTPTVLSFSTRQQALAFMQLSLHPGEAVGLGWEYSTPGIIGHMVIAWLKVQEVGRSGAEVHWLDHTQDPAQGATEAGMQIGWPKPDMVRPEEPARWTVFRHPRANILTASVARDDSVTGLTPPASAPPSAEVTPTKPSQPQANPFSSMASSPLSGQTLSPPQSAMPRVSQGPPLTDEMRQKKKKLYDDIRTGKPGAKAQMMHFNLTRHLEGAQECADKLGEEIDAAVAATAASGSPAAARRRIGGA